MKFPCKVWSVLLISVIFLVVPMISTSTTTEPIPIYGEGSAPVGLTQGSQQIIVAILTIFIFLFMAMEMFSPVTLLFSALIICLMLQILTLPETLAGYSNESMITIGALFIVVGGVEKSHVVDWLARKTFGSGGSALLGKVRMYITCFFLSIFFNNTPLVAILMPVIKDWGRMRNIAASQLLIPLSYSVLAGSFISMIGTSTNLTIQGLMQADRGYSFSFFAPAPMGVVCFTALLIYMIILGPHLLPDEKVGLLRTARDKAATMMAEIYVSPDSRAAGKSVGEVMNSLGVAPSCMIKIRRRVNTDGLSRAPSMENTRAAEASKSRLGANILDAKYLRSKAKSWKSHDSPHSDDGSVAQSLEDEESNNLDGEDSAEYTDIIAPSHHELVAPHDVLFVSSAQDMVEKMMKSIAGESKGLFILNSNALALPGFGTELLECVVSDTNPFLGQRVSQFSAAFAEKYKAGLITVRGKDWFDEPSVAPSSASTATANTAHKEELHKTALAASVSSYSATTALEKSGNGKGEVREVEMTGIRETGGKGYSAVDSADSNNDYEVDLESAAESSTAGADTAALGEGIGQGDGDSGVPAGAPSTFIHANPEVTVSDHVLGYGDIILCVSNSREVDALSHSRDFFVVSTVGSLPKPLDLYKSIPVVIFIAMLVLVATEQINMCPASLCVATVYLLGGWVTASEIPNLVDIKLLILIGSSISYAKAVTKCGLALEIASTISDVDSGPQGLMFLVYAITLMMTELITNNAAAALMYPIAVAVADELGVSFKPFAMCVLMASTAGFMSPIGYQTHMMVWAPGGYKFKNFIIFGVLPDIIYWIISCLLIPAIFPF